MTGDEKGRATEDPVYKRVFALPVEAHSPLVGLVGLDGSLVDGVVTLPYKGHVIDLLRMGAVEMTYVSLVSNGQRCWMHEYVGLTVENLRRAYAWIENELDALGLETL